MGLITELLQVKIVDVRLVYSGRKIAEIPTRYYNGQWCIGAVEAWLCPGDALLPSVALLRNDQGHLETHLELSPNRMREEIAKAPHGLIMYISERHQVRKEDWAALANLLEEETCLTALAM